MGEASPWALVFKGQAGKGSRGGCINSWSDSEKEVTHEETQIVQTVGERDTHTRVSAPKAEPSTSSATVPDHSLKKVQSWRLSNQFQHQKDLKGCLVSCWETLPGWTTRDIWTPRKLYTDWMSLIQRAWNQKCLDFRSYQTLEYLHYTASLIQKIRNLKCSKEHSLWLLYRCSKSSRFWRISDFLFSG